MFLKKRFFWILCFLTALIFCVNRFSGSSIKYPSGKDTIESFGDGTYQISSGNSNGLFNEKYGNCIIQNVDKFHITDEKIYVIGSTEQNAVVDGVEIKRSYIIYSVIELENNTMELFCVPNNPLHPNVFIVRLDEMIENCDVRLLSFLSDFSAKDLTVFHEMESIQ